MFSGFDRVLRCRFWLGAPDLVVLTFDRPNSLGQANRICRAGKHGTCVEADQAPAMRSMVRRTWRRWTAGICAMSIEDYGAAALWRSGRRD